MGPEPRPSALDNPGFRRLALWLAGVPILCFYLWSTLVQPLLVRPVFPDFAQCFRAATRLRGGVDPYLSFLAIGHYSYNGSECAYAPLTPWLVEPFTPLGEENAALVVLVLLQLCLVAFLVLFYRGLRPVSRHEVALGALLLLGFEPVFANLWNDQSNILVLLVSAVVLGAYLDGDHWRGGVAYGLAIAIKPLQPAVGLLLFWGRRWWMVAAAVAAGVLASLLPGPRLLWEYLTRVLPAETGGTGFRDNAAPAGFLERLFHPATFYDGTAQGGLAVRGLYAAVVVAVLAVTWWRLGRSPRADRQGRAVEMATAVAASPLLLTISHTFHAALLLVPILLLVHVGLERRDRRLLGAAAIGWLCLGPVHSGMLTAIGNRFTVDAVLRIWNESQLLGMVVIWLGCLAALRARRSSRPEPLSPRLRSSR